MKIYAQIDNGLVVNTISWDGEGDMFKGYVMVELKNGIYCSTGNFYNPKDEGFYIDEEFTQIAGSVVI